MISELKDFSGKKHINTKDQVQVMMEYFRNLYQSINPKHFDIERFLETSTLLGNYHWTIKILWVPLSQPKKYQRPSRE